MGEWRPAHSSHAIERCSVSLAYSEPVPAKAWQAVLSAMSLRAAEHGYGLAVDEMEPQLPIMFGPQGPIAPIGFQLAQPHQGASPSGRHFQLVEGAQLREEVLLSRTRALFSSTRYDGWKLFFERVREMLEAAYTSIQPLVDIAVLRLEYWDRFTFDGTADEIVYEDLLRLEGKTLLGLPRLMNELWHSHVGFFLPEEPVGRFLINLNVDVADVPDPLMPIDPSRTGATSRSVGIYSLAQLSLAPDGSSKSFGEVAAILDDLHIKSNASFADVISDGIAERIGLRM